MTKSRSQAMTLLHDGPTGRQQTEKHPEGTSQQQRLATRAIDEDHGEDGEDYVDCPEHNRLPKRDIAGVRDPAKDSGRIVKKYVDAGDLPSTASTRPTVRTRRSCVVVAGGCTSASRISSKVSAPVRAATFSASWRRPRISRKRAVSGTTKSRPSSSVDGTMPEANIQRHPRVWFHSGVPLRWMR